MPETKNKLPTDELKIIVLFANELISFGMRDHLFTLKFVRDIVNELLDLREKLKISSSNS